LRVSHGRHAAAAAGASDDLWTELRRETDARTIDLILLSRNSRFVRNASDGRDAQPGTASLVVRTIEEVLESATTGTRLAP